jgi:hypothetical protein
MTDTSRSGGEGRSVSPKSLVSVDKLRAEEVQI